MPRVLAALVMAVAVVATGCSILTEARVIGSGNAATEQLQVDTFSKVRVDTAVQATVIVGPDTTVSITTDDNILSSVKATVVAGRLSVSIEGSVQPRVPVQVAITTPTLESVEAGSAASITATGVNADSFSAGADSAGSVVVRGNASHVDVTANSAGSADLGGVPAQTASVNVGSAGRATVNAQHSVDGKVDSGGSVRVEGNPASVNVATDSGGSVVRD